jgi:hypothetical protein
MSDPSPRKPDERTDAEARPKRRRGAQPGNRNAVCHGRYSQDRRVLVRELRSIQLRIGTILAVLRASQLIGNLEFRGNEPRRSRAKSLTTKGETP